MIFHYTDMNSRPALTDIERQGPFIIATELRENTGASVTNSAELIATQYAEQNGIPLDELVFVERYDERSYDGATPRNGFPSYSLVEFTVNLDSEPPYLTSPKWTQLSEPVFDELSRQMSIVEKRGGWLDENDVTCEDYANFLCS